MAIAIKSLIIKKTFKTVCFQSVFRQFPKKQESIFFIFKLRTKNINSTKNVFALLFQAEL